LEISNKLALVLDGDLIVVVLDAGAFFLAPAHAVDDIVATELENCKDKTLLISPNPDIEGICGVQSMVSAGRHVGRKNDHRGIDTKRALVAPGQIGSKRLVVKQNPHNLSID